MFLLFITLFSKTIKHPYTNKSTFVVIFGPGTLPQEAL